MLKYNPKLKKLSRNLRKGLTKPERILWQYLRRNQIYSLRFSRQKPMGDYILDFYCHKIKLAIELDGDQHYYKEGKIKDQERDMYLKTNSIDVLRFGNYEIFTNIKSVVQKIHMVVEGKLKNPLNPPLKKGK